MAGGRDVSSVAELHRGRTGTSAGAAGVVPAADYGERPALHEHRRRGRDRDAASGGADGRAGSPRSRKTDDPPRGDRVRKAAGQGGPAATGVRCAAPVYRHGRRVRSGANSARQWRRKQFASENF